MDPKYVKVRTRNLRLQFRRSQFYILGVLPVRTPRDRFFLKIQVLNFDARFTAHTTRRAQCHLQMLKPQLAIGDFRRVLAIDPHNKSVKEQLEATQKLVRKIEFEKVG